MTENSARGVLERRAAILHWQTEQARLAAVTADPLNAELDPGIRDIVISLRRGGIETYESCHGGPGHAYPEPTVAFHGGAHEGYRAVAWALAHGWKVMALRRAWRVEDGELVGPAWEMTFFTDGAFWWKDMLRAEEAPHDD